MEQLAPLIAVVGCDGSGKSTLAADILDHVRQNGRAESGYLGLGSGAIGNSIKAWPLVGPAFERFLARKATRARDPKDKIPGLSTAIVLYFFSLRRQARFKKVLSLRRKGIIVVTDRYPQIDVPGFYDGPGLSAARAEGWLTSYLARNEREIYTWMASFVPTLVIRLHVDATTALSRKPDHNPTLIEKKVAATPLLKFNGATITELDATSPYDQVKRGAMLAVDKALGEAVAKR